MYILYMMTCGSFDAYIRKPDGGVLSGVESGSQLQTLRVECCNILYFHHVSVDVLSFLGYCLALISNDEVGSCRCVVVVMYASGVEWARPGCGTIIDARLEHVASAF